MGGRSSRARRPTSCPAGARRRFGAARRGANVPPPRVLPPDLVHGCTDGALRRRVERAHRLDRVEAGAAENPDHGVDHVAHGVPPQAAVHELHQDLGLLHEGAVDVTGPLAQPLVPVLAGVFRSGDAGQRMLGGQHEQLAPVGDVVVEAGHADAQLVGHRLHGDAVEPEVEHGLCDGGSVDAGRTPDFGRRHQRAAIADAPCTSVCDGPIRAAIGCSFSTSNR